MLGTLYEPAEAPAGDPWRASDAEWAERLAAALEGPLALLTNTSERPTDLGDADVRPWTTCATFAGRGGA